MVLRCCHYVSICRLTLTVALLPANIKYGILLRFEFRNSLVRIRAFLNTVPRETFQMCFRETHLIILNAELRVLGVPHSYLGPEIACNCLTQLVMSLSSLK